MERTANEQLAEADAAAEAQEEVDAEFGKSGPSLDGMILTIKIVDNKARVFADFPSAGNWDRKEPARDMLTEIELDVYENAPKPQYVTFFEASLKKNFVPDNFRLSFSPEICTMILLPPFLRELFTNEHENEILTILDACDYWTADASILIPQAVKTLIMLDKPKFIRICKRIIIDLYDLT